MKKTVIILSLIFCAHLVLGQSKTTDALQSQYENSLALYFYKNTLKMLNQTDNKELDELVKDIEKMKFLMVNKTKGNFGTNEYKKLKTDYQKEDYESVMTGRRQGKNFDVFFKDARSPGTVVLVNDSTNLYVIDIIGTIDVNKVGELFSSLDKSTDIGKKIREFTRHD